MNVCKWDLWHFQHSWGSYLGNYLTNFNDSFCNVLLSSISFKGYLTQLSRHPTTNLGPLGGSFLGPLTPRYPIHNFFYVFFQAWGMRIRNLKLKTFISWRVMAKKIPKNSSIGHFWAILVIWAGGTRGRGPWGINCSIQVWDLICRFLEDILSHLGGVTKVLGICTPF